jgi:large subunit ribosomal protein L29
MPSKAAELRGLPDDELLARIESAKEELFNLRFQLATGQLDNTTRLRELKRDVARAATVLRERELEHELDALASAPAGTTRDVGQDAGGTEEEQ